MYLTAGETPQKISEPKDLSGKLPMSINRWRNEHRMYNTECCSATEENELLIHRTTDETQKHYVMEKKAGTKSTCCMISLTQNSRKGKSNLFWRKISRCQGSGIWVIDRKGSWGISGHDGDILSIVEVDTSTSVFTYVKTHQICTLKMGSFILCKLYLNNVD